MFSSFLIGCTFNPDEQEPSFIAISDYDLSTDPLEGTSSNAITELWVYVNGDVQGVFDAPASIPVLRTGNNTVSVYAGIKNNGIGSTRIRYPFYAPFDTVLNLQPLETYALKPHFSYYPSAVINTERDFQSESGNFFQPGPNNFGSVELIIDNNIAVDGGKCGKFSLSATNGYMHFIDDYVLEMESGNTVFLEMDYSCNNTFSLGVYTIDNSDQVKNQVIYLTPTTSDSGANPTWNKIYIDLGLVASYNPNADYYKIFFECASNESATPTIFLDNLKVVNW